MRSAVRALLTVAVVAAVFLALAARMRVARVEKSAVAIPVYPGAREAGGRTRFFPRLLAWDDRSDARVQRVFALSQATGLVTIARHADSILSTQGWYLLLPEELDRIANPQVIVWQREPDERLDLTQLWPIDGMTRTQRLHGGIFPAEFLDAPLVIEWNWALGGARSPPRMR